MRFMMFVCRDTVDPGPATPVDRAIEEWVDRMDASGRRVIGAPLAPEGEATAVRVRNGERRITRTAVVQTDEVLLGFDVLECRDLAEAIEIAVEHPLAARGVLELRAIE